MYYNLYRDLVTFEGVNENGIAGPKSKKTIVFQLELCEPPNSSKLVFSIFFGYRPGSMHYGTFVESIPALTLTTVKDGA